MENNEINGKSPKRYVLNSAVITTPGMYSYHLIDQEKAQKWLADGNFESTIGYQETCDALEIISGVKVPMNRKQIRMQPADEALVFRLTGFRLGDPTMKGKLTKEFVLKNCELGILRKEE